MIRIATVADFRFRNRAGNLVRSLENSPNDYRITVYCDDEKAFRPLSSSRCEVVELAEMRRLGAKRCKLTAFANALQQGSVLYLDADAIVLEDLSEFWGGSVVKGVFVDLATHPFIADPVHPWPGDPALVNHCYIMSTAFYAPAELHGAFDQFRLASLDDATWRRYIAEGHLYDQHFLNAQLNQQDVAVKLLDPTVFGWEGLLKDRKVQVYRAGRRLINKQTQRTLRVVLFGGPQQTSELLRSLPMDIAALILERIAPERLSLDEALEAVYAALSDRLGQSSADPLARDILALLLSEIPHVAGALNTNAHALKGHRYLNNPEGLRSVAFAGSLSSCTWNGLRCGGSYLDAGEYSRIREIVRTLKIRTVLETGAGETSILFRNLGTQTWSLEYQWGEWADRAVAHGCTCLLVPFDNQGHRFAEPDLSNALSSHRLRQVDLLFIDSPIGTLNRRNLFGQLTSLVKPRFVLYHDSLRDAANIFEDQMRHALKLIDFVDSPRGMALFAVPPCEKARPLAHRFDAATVVAEPGTSIAIVDCPASAAPADHFQVRVALTNTTAAMLSSRYTRPVHMAYHWLTQAGDVLVFDGLRTELPTDLEHGDSAEFLFEAVAPEQEGEYFLEAALVQEHVAWFENTKPEAARAHLSICAQNALRS